VRCRPGLEILENRDVPSGGVLDPTFGTNGVVTTDVASDNASFASAVATYPKEGTANDGKIVAVGVVTGNNQAQAMAVVRYNLDGSLDTSFGGSGQVTTSVGSAREGAGDVIVQPDGKVVVAGWTGGISSNFALVRYNADGSLDTSFGTGGKVTHQFSAPLAANIHGGIDLAIDPSTNPLDSNAGKIVVAAQLGTDTSLGPMVVLRLNTNGSPDTSFGSNGAGYVSITTLNGGDVAAVAVQSDDRIVVAGINPGTPNTGQNIGLARFNPDGTPDATFGSGGFVDAPLPNNEKARSLALRPDGKIVVAGDTDNLSQPNGSHQFMVARFNAADGSLDTSFGTGGLAVSTGFNVDVDKVDMALEPDGRIVVAGTIPFLSSVSGNHFALARFLAAGPQVDSVVAATVGSLVTLTASNVVPLDPGSTVTQVAFYQDSNGDGVFDTGDALLGYGSRSSAGTWTLTFSAKSLASGTYTFFAVAQDSYGAFGDPLAITVQVL
jgi:uncharacterized delta-60 repeat protein